MDTYIEFCIRFWEATRDLDLYSMDGSQLDRLIVDALSKTNGGKELIKTSMNELSVLIRAISHNNRKIQPPSLPSNPEEPEKPSDQEPEVDLNGKVTFDNKTILRVETDEKKKRVLEIIGLEESCCNYPLNYENETDDCYYEEYNDRIYIDGNITFNQMREIVEYIENK